MTLRALCDGAVIADIDGHGPVGAVLLHGWARDRTDLAQVGEAIRSAVPGIRVVSFDLPGFGSAPPPSSTWATGEYGELLVEALDELAGDAAAGAAAPVLVGHSFGGRVAVYAAAIAPSLVSGLVLAGVPLLRPAESPPRRPALAYRTARRLHRLGLLGDDRMERLRRRFGSPDYAAATGVMRSVLVSVVAEEYPDELAQLSVPVAFVWGAGDSAAPVEVAQRAAALLGVPHTLDVMDGVGHDVHHTHPDVFAQRVAELLERSGR